MKDILQAIYIQKKNGKVINYTLNLGGLKFFLRIVLKDHSYIDINGKYDKDYYSLHYFTMFQKHRMPYQIILQLNKICKKVI